MKSKTEYEGGFKVGDKVKHKFREHKYQNCEVLPLKDDRLPFVQVIEDGVVHELPWMDLIKIS